MATYSTGITATFAGTSFAEVVDLSWSYGGALPKGRDSAWTNDVGSVTLTCLSSSGVSTATYGTRDNLVIAGGGAALTATAVYQNLSVATEVNGVTRYTVTFHLLDG